VLEELLERLQVEKGVESLTELTADMHLYPDFHGRFFLLSRTFQMSENPPTIREPVTDRRPAHEGLNRWTDICRYSSRSYFSVAVTVPIYAGSRTVRPSPEILPHARIPRAPDQAHRRSAEHRVAQRNRKRKSPRDLRIRWAGGERAVDAVVCGCV